jgi:hypothetical protein
MNCDCVNVTEKELAKFMQQQAGDNATATCGIVGFSLGSSLALTLSIPFRVKGSKKGYTSERGKEVIVVASYCPFCGVSTKKPEVSVNTSQDAEDEFNPPALSENTN